MRLWGERRGGGVGRLIEGGGVGRPDGKNLQILDLHRLAPLRYSKCTPIIQPHQTREHRLTSNSIYEKVRRSFSMKPT